jgi:integrase
MSTANPTGYVRVIKRTSGPVFYAHIRASDGRRLQRKLGRAWTTRSRPPRGYLTRTHAEAKLAEILAGENPDVVVAPASGATFSHAAREWLRYIEHDRGREHSTVQGYRSAVQTRLLPRFAHLPLEALIVDLADRWRVELLAEGLSPNTINKLRWYGEAIYKRAQRVWKITTNPFAHVERQPQRPPDDFKLLEPAETLQLAIHAANDQDAALFVVVAFTGLRLGELRALRWSDLNFADRLVHVRRSYTRGQLKPYPKGRRRRSVPMIDQVIPPLDRLSQREHFTEPDDLVFVNAAGGVIDESALRRRLWAALDRAELKRVRLHDLRHSYCTMAVRAYRLDEVKAYAGHVDIATTQRYVHHVPAHDAADRLSAVVAAAVHPTVHRTPEIEPNLAQLSETKPLQIAAIATRTLES